MNYKINVKYILKIAYILTIDYLILALWIFDNFDSIDFYSYDRFKIKIDSHLYVR